MYFWNFFILLVLKNEIFSQNIIKFDTMASHLDFECYCFNCHVYITVAYSLKV